ncbi:MAG: hypothetical protein ACRCTA_03880 [Bacilli bacterium]
MLSRNIDSKLKEALFYNISVPVIFDYYSNEDILELAPYNISDKEETLIMGNSIVTLLN